MRAQNHFNGRTIHIDVSRRFYQKGDSGIAFRIIPSQIHGGGALSNKLKKELARDLQVDKNYELLHAICIYYLICNELDNFDNLVICNDELYSKVKNYLDFLFNGNSKYSSKLIISLSRLREISGDNKIRSYADNVANIYRKKGLKPLTRKQRGVKLNLIDLGYQRIRQKWEEVIKNMK